MLAVAMETTTGEIIDYDPNYVRWYAQDLGKKNSVKQHLNYAMEPCTSAQLNKLQVAQNYETE